MPRLVPNWSQGAFNRVANFLIPAEIKSQALSEFLNIVDGIDVAFFETFVANDVSIWRQLVPDEQKKVILEGSKDYLTYVKMSNQELILGWIFEARPDFRKAIDTQQGRLWFWKQWEEVMRELGVSSSD